METITTIDGARQIWTTSSTTENKEDNKQTRRTDRHASAAEKCLVQQFKVFTTKKMSRTSNTKSVHLQVTAFNFIEPEC